MYTGFLWEYVQRQMHMRQLMHRIKHHHIVECLTKWNNVVQDARIAHVTGQNSFDKMPQLVQVRPA